MGFNKKFISDDKILYWLENNLPLDKLFKADAIIFEGNLSSKIYDLYKEGISDNEILKKIKENAI